MPRAVSGVTNASSAINNTYFIAAIYRDAANNRNFSSAQILFRQDIDGRNACYIGYDRVHNLVYLVDDTGSKLLPKAIKPNTGTSDKVENAQCLIDATSTGITESGTDLTLTVYVQFKPAFAGPKIMYTGVQTVSGANSGWQALGTLTVQ